MPSVTIVVYNMAASTVLLVALLVLPMAYSQSMDIGNIGNIGSIGSIGNMDGGDFGMGSMRELENGMGTGLGSGLGSGLDGGLDGGEFGLGPSLGRASGHFGQPSGAGSSSEGFNKETTSDERISARINPIPFIFNPAIRTGVTGLQNIEQRYHQRPYPQKALLAPFLLLTNPSKKRK